MENELKTLKQATPFGCFVNCYAMVESYFNPEFKFGREKELELLEKSFSFDRECYEPYLIAKLKKDFAVDVVVESDYLVWKYRTLSSELENDIDPEHRLLYGEDYREAAEKGLAIILLDKWTLDMYTHFAHWVVLSGYSDGIFCINDSWAGKEIKVPENRLMDSIDSLRNTLNCSPVLIEVEGCSQDQ